MGKNPKKENKNNDVVQKKNKTKLRIGLFRMHINKKENPRDPLSFIRL
jgi:hypothetical protein